MIQNFDPSIVSYKFELIFMKIKQKKKAKKKAKKKKKKIDEKNSKWPIFLNGRFSKSPILKKFPRKFQRSALGLVELIDAKGIDLAQPIWP